MVLCRLALHIAQLRRLKQAVDRRDETVGRVAKRMAEHQRKMVNLAVQLRALYEGRKEDVGGLMGGSKGGGEGGEGGEKTE